MEVGYFHLGIFLTAGEPKSAREPLLRVGKPRVVTDELGTTVSELSPTKWAGAWFISSHGSDTRACVYMRGLPGALADCAAWLWRLNGYPCALGSSESALGLSSM